MNAMIKAIMSDFTANFVPDAECLYLRDADVLAWDTVAWIADVPEHMVHFEKQRTLEPR